MISFFSVEAPEAYKHIDGLKFAKNLSLILASNKPFSGLSLKPIIPFCPPTPPNIMASLFFYIYQIDIPPINLQQNQKYLN